MKKIITIFSILLLANCANVKNYKNSDFGDSRDYEKKVTNYIMATASNPEKIKIVRIGKLKKTFIQNMAPSALWNPFFPVYGVCVNYYGQNYYGATILTQNNFFIKDGVVSKGSETLDKYEPCLMK